MGGFELAMSCSHGHQDLLGALTTSSTVSLKQFMMELWGFSGSSDHYYSHPFFLSVSTGLIGVTVADARHLGLDQI